jgi:hypothetical protein
VPKDNPIDIVSAALADLRDAVPTTEVETLRGIDLAVISIATRLRERFPRFDAQGFIDATGYVSPETRALMAYREQGARQDRQLGEEV